MTALDFHRDGLTHFAGTYGLAAVEALRQLPSDAAGTRLLDDRLPEFLAPVSRLAARILGISAQPVRAVMFDKSANNNWALGWHQDRTLVVQDRVAAPGFGPWSRKDGALHVAPPIEILQRMATFRIHLDPCGPDNAPLKAAQGTHRLGFVPADQAATVANQHQIIECLAEVGDVWAYSTPILHASVRATKPTRRRVLQVDYATFALPGGMQWRGVTEKLPQTAAEWARENADAIEGQRERIHRHGMWSDGLRTW